MVHLRLDEFSKGVSECKFKKRENPINQVDQEKPKKEQIGRGSQQGKSKATCVLSQKLTEERITRKKELSNMAIPADNSKTGWKMKSEKGKLVA